MGTSPSTMEKDRHNVRGCMLHFAGTLQANHCNWNDICVPANLFSSTILSFLFHNLALALFFPRWEHLTAAFNSEDEQSHCDFHFYIMCLRTQSGVKHLQGENCFVSILIHIWWPICRTLDTISPAVLWRAECYPVIWDLLPVSSCPSCRRCGS